MTNATYVISARLKSNSELVYFGTSGGWTRLIKSAHGFSRQIDANTVSLLVERDYLVSAPVVHKKFKSNLPVS